MMDPEKAMPVQILHRYTDAVLKSIVADNLCEADLRGADLCYAYLSGANLSEADLREANLSGAYLSGANLSEADLREANLSGAYLREANLRGTNLSEADCLTASGYFLRLAGSRHAIIAIDAQNISIGCHRKTLAEWLDKYAAIGAEEGYTPAQIAEYRRHLEYTQEWLLSRPVKGGSDA